MKHKRLLFLLALLMTAATGAWAQQTLTVYDGTTKDNTSPAYIGYSDEYTRSQTVIPSTALTAMKGCDITAMKFYSNSMAASGKIDYSFDVYLKEVSYSAFAESSTFEPKSSCTTVYQGTLSISNYELTITFSKPFHYNGGNLLIGMENTSKVMYYEIRFLGTSTGSSLSNICTHDSHDLTSATLITNRYFIPKTTFTYEDPTYSVKLADGTEDAKNWSIASGEKSATGDAADGLTGLKEGDAVTLTYGGRLKVKGVKATSDAAAPSVPDGAISGVFSVSSTKKVYFSKGNLRYESDAWSFFDNQYDYYESYSEEADVWDKFGWSTSAPTYGMNTTTSISEYSGDFVDWGATMGTGWFTLSSDEWTYLINTRTTGGTVFGTSSARYAHATINTDGTGVNGMILFPDGVDIASTEVTTAGSVNATSAYATKCTTAQWSALAAKGCVFLPAAGRRNGSSMDYAGMRSYYWSATPNGNYTAYQVSFFSDNLTPANSSTRFLGCSVRLVREVATIDEQSAEEPVTLATPLTVEAVTPGTITVQIGYGTGTLSTGMKYSVNGGTKTLITTTTPIEGLKAGDKVQFYGNGIQTQVYGGDTEVSIQGSGDGFQTKVYGNIMSLLDEDGFATKTDLPNTEYVFYGLFIGNTTLIDASELLLPATSLAYGCYQQMFYKCSSLTTAPKLPATTLATTCYGAMFMDCKSLTTAPKLPATTLAVQCYYNMFSGCTSLTSAYVKAAYIDENIECLSMFDRCSATGAVLHTAPGSKASWEAKMGTDKTWDNWTVADDWEE